MNKEEKLENELSELRTNLKKLQKEEIKLKEQIKTKEKELCDLLDYDMSLDTI